ncbi:hypothetical protein Acor_01520 [Acrocarpospora corrugata]|uniref:Uncharacterized protein n=1 Tax=Acrocarpospora corrugata TaxID=35763 RepID=A0A5M3VTQ3_9ACTN|nr:hypothetical protein [Acrocarpospora corrugata]GER98090.1 hypothetical protein Acor_01520 [Acrocarpospora corrugata]
MIDFCLTGGAESLLEEAGQNLDDHSDEIKTARDDLSIAQDFTKLPKCLKQNGDKASMLRARRLAGR